LPAPGNEVVSQLEKYIRLAKNLKMEHAQFIGPKDLFFDNRVMLKCLWGCNEHTPENIKCDDRGSTLQKRMDIVRSYENILLLHSHNANLLSKAVLEIERQAFLDGNYLAAGIRSCNLC
jgi:predicted metal-binding protein